MKKNLLRQFLALALAAQATVLFTETASAQTEWRNFRSAAWSNTSTGNSNGTWQTYSSSTQTWTNNQPTPGENDNATLRDGIFMTSNGNYTINNLSVGEGGGALATATITNGAVSNITISDPGSMIAIPTVTFLGASTTIAAATVTSLKVTGVSINSVGGTTAGQTAYDNTTTVTIGTAWAPNTAYTVGTQRSNGGNLYTVTTAGTSETSGSGPSGSGSSISDGTVIWAYAGKAATATPIISNGSVTGITITESGSGYTSIPAITITGVGTGASYSAKIGVENILITNGGTGYQTAPEVMMGANWQVGNSTTLRTFTTKGNVTFKKGAYYYHPGTANEILIIGGNLTAETPITFYIKSGTISNVTNVTFSHASAMNHTTSGSKIVFNDLTIANGHTLNITNDVIVHGILTNNGTLNITGNATFLGTVTNTGTINGSYSTVLPVHISKFNTRAVRNGIITEWSTSSETNSDKFVVEKSTDGVNFVKFAEVKSKGPSSYSVEDKAPASGWNYYRLVQYDNDGKSTVYGPEAVNFTLNASQSLSVYPNPSTDGISFKLEGLTGTSTVILSDLQGKVVHTETISNTTTGTYKLNLKQQPAAGQYLLQVNNNSGKQTSKVIIL